MTTALRQSSPPTGFNFSYPLNMYQIMLKRTSITYSICLFLNGSLYGSLHAHKQSFSKNLNLQLQSSKISSLNHYCTIDSYLGSEVWVFEVGSMLANISRKAIHYYLNYWNFHSEWEIIYFWKGSTRFFDFKFGLNSILTTKCFDKWIKRVFFYLENFIVFLLIYFILYLLNDCVLIFSL